jgi:Fe-S cluster assembly protein SufD
MAESILKSPSFNGAQGWWADAQKAAWSRFESLPMPVRTDEDWRFSSINAVKLDGLNAAEAVKSAQSKEWIAKSKVDFEAAGQAIFGNDQLLDYKAKLPNGVIWEPFEKAISEHGDLLKKHFMTQAVSLGSDKFAALHQSRCRAGMLLYVPKNVEVQLPLVTLHWVGAGSIFPHTLIIAEANSKVTVVDLFKGGSRERSMVCAVNDLHLGTGAQVTYVAKQLLSENTLSFQLNFTKVEKDASAKSLFVNLGGGFSRIESKSSLVGQGARSEMLSLSVGDADQVFDHRTLQQHAAPNTWSDLLYKNALDYGSKSIFKGLIRVEPGAVNTDAYQTNRNLLLSAEAEADTMPGLEILNDEVKCSHGATTSQIDESEMFYFQARGIKPQVARKLLALGFFEEILQRLNHEQISKEIRREIEAKFASSKPSDKKEEKTVADETNVRELQGTV